MYKQVFLAVYLQVFEIIPIFADKYNYKYLNSISMITIIIIIVLLLIIFGHGNTIKKNFASLGEVEKQSWITDFGSDVAANIFTDGLILLGRKLFGKI